MDTKLKSDIAESAVVTELLRRGFKVLKPVGDRLPYDLAIDLRGKLLRIQVKSAWLQKGAYTVDTRRTKTNRRHMVRERYNENDFDFAVLYIDELKVSYVMPASVFSTYKSGISLVEGPTRQRKPKSAEYRESWDLLSEWAAQSVTVGRNLSNSVKPEPVVGLVIPSQVLSDPPRSLVESRRKGVETRRQAPHSCFHKKAWGEGIVQTTNLVPIGQGQRKLE